jgi:hypothetical protein
MRKTILSLAMAGCYCFCLGQTASEKQFNHYVGVQGNQLIRQILNFSNAASVVSNPYLLSYSFNSVQTGWGGALGLGYNYNQLGDGNSTFSRTTKINDLFLRIGFEKKTSLSERWLLSVGGDVVRDSENDVTETFQNLPNQLPDQTFKTKSHNHTWGAGPRAALYFMATKKILIGTESSYYFKSGKNTVTNDSFSPSSSSSGTHDETTKTVKKIQFTLPAVLFLVIKF